MKQFPVLTFEESVRQAMQKARKNGSVTKVTEAVDRATELIQMDPAKVEEIFLGKMQEGVKL